MSSISGTEMTTQFKKYILVTCCICASANIIYLIVPRSYVAVEKDPIMTAIVGKTKERKLPTSLAPDARKLKEASQHFSLEDTVDSRNNTYRHDIYTFEINQQLICKQIEETEVTSVDLVVIVISNIRNFLRRMAIRNTWGSDVHESLPNVRLLFMVGRSMNGAIQSQIEKEAELFGDILQINVDETYENLTNKSVAMLHWLREYCNKAQFALKSDDDMYINLHILLQQLQKRTEPEFFLCYVFKDAPPVRDEMSKWYTSVEEYKYDFFPRYCSGTAYSFSVKIASKLFEVSKQIKFLKMEDVYVTGLLTQSLNIPVIHNDRFWFLKRKSIGCEYKTAISGHEVSVTEMYIIHAQLKDTAIDCEKNINYATAGDENDMFQKWQQSDVT